MRGDIIAESGDAEIIDHGKNELVKLFRPHVARDRVEKEAWIMRLIRQVGIEGPFVHGVIEIDGRFGILYDKVHGPNYLEWVMQNARAVDKMSRYFAYLHHEVHQHKLPELPSLKDSLESDIKRSGLDPETVSRVQRILDRLPDGDHVCHLDFHPANIIVSLDGPVIMDWADVARGHYLADVAKTLLILDLGAVLKKLPMERKDEGYRLLQRFRGIHLTEYMKISGRSDEEREQWMAPLAAARMAMGIPDELDRLRGIIEDALL